MISTQLLVEPLLPILVVDTRNWYPVSTGLERVHHSWKPRLSRIGVDEHFAPLDHRQRLHWRERSEQVTVSSQLLLHPLSVHIVLGDNFVSGDFCDLPVTPAAGAGRVNLYLLPTLVDRDFFRPRIIRSSSSSSSSLWCAPHRSTGLLIHVVRSSSGVPQLSQLLWLHLLRGRVRCNRRFRGIRLRLSASPRCSQRGGDLLGHRKIGNAHAYMSVISLLDSGGLSGHGFLVLLCTGQDYLGHLLMLYCKCSLVLLGQLLHPGVQLRGVPKGCRPGWALH
mmetsp:Transcript_94021/g.215132  ORF Transcript_94021/g.215132 Transcript_94021/m.215132 type:complete len:279 (+) Transcript_94021:389-1225(+)